MDDDFMDDEDYGLVSLSFVMFWFVVARLGRLDYYFHREIGSTQVNRRIIYCMGK